MYYMQRKKKCLPKKLSVKKTERKSLTEARVKHIIKTWPWCGIRKKSIDVVV